MNENQDWAVDRSNRAVSREHLGDSRVEELAFEIFARIEAQEIESMSIEQVEAELRASGIDAEAVVQRIRRRVEELRDGSANTGVG